MARDFPCPACHIPADFLWSGGKNGVTRRKYECGVCGRDIFTSQHPRHKTEFLVEMPRDSGWPKPDRKWSDLGLSPDAFA